MFQRNQIYRRSTLHDQYGGNRQSGISDCKNHPIIFIFSSEAGEAHGYEDGWDGQNYFKYTGEGQMGDMEFTKGNKAILDHEANRKSVFLFEKISRGEWRYIDELTLVDYEYFETPDNSGNLRQGIKFRFKSTSEESITSEGRKRISKDYNKPNLTERTGLVKSRVGQGWYRKQLLQKWENKCAVTNCNLNEILIASHIVPWSESNDTERLDIGNGILLSPNLDALFDQHMISFNDNGSILINDNVPIDLLGLRQSMKLRFVTEDMKKYLKMHREKYHAKD